MTKSRKLRRVEKVAQKWFFAGACESGIWTDFEALSSHLFLSKYQYQQAVNLRDNLPKGVLLCSHDFSMNFSCYRQNQVQSAFYENSMSTIHGSVAHFRCETPGCQKVVRMEIIHLSKILLHNASAFNQFNIKTVNIAEAEAETNFKLVVNITDQAPSQYKNKNSFLYTSKFGKPLIHFFLGSRHGKFWSDAAIGRFVQWLRKEIAADIVEVACAADIAKHAQKKYATPNLDRDQCQHFRIKINLVDRIPRNPTDSERVEGTRIFHMIRNTGRKGYVLSRNIGCLCLACISGEGSCKYPEYFDDWSEQCVQRTSLGGPSLNLWPVNFFPSGETTDANVQASNESTQIFSESQNWDFDVEIEETNIGDSVSVTVPHQQCRNESDNEVQSSSQIINPIPILNGNVNESKNEEVQASSQIIEPLPVLNGNVKSWAEVLTSMKKSKSYIELQDLCSNLSLPPLSSDFKEQYDSGLDDIDGLTLDILKSAEISISRSLQPISIYADGNCFPRCLSRFVFGTQCRHGEMRVRLVKEGVMNEEQYLDNTHLKVGTRAEIQKTNIVEMYCLCSDHRDTCRKLTRRSIQRIYQNELYEFRLLGRFSGMFQLHSAANALQVKVESYFPDRTVDAVFMHANRAILPFGRTVDDHLKSCRVVWTKSRPESAYLQHFVPLVQSEM